MKGETKMEITAIGVQKAIRTAVKAATGPETVVTISGRKSQGGSFVVVYVNDLSGADYNFYRKAIAKHGDNPIVREMENNVIQFRNDHKLHPRNMNYCNNMIADVRRIGAMGYVIPTSSRYSNWYRGQIGYQLRNNIPKPDWYDELKEVAHIFTNKDNKYDKSLKRWNDDIKLDDEPQK